MIKLSIRTANAAFNEDGKQLEAARIIKSAADKVEAGDFDFKLFDINGNSVGRVMESFVENQDPLELEPGENYITLEIDTGNAAFEGDDKGFECARIMREASAKIRDGELGFKLRDGNGNGVGRVEEVVGNELPPAGIGDAGMRPDSGSLLAAEQSAGPGLYEELKAAGVVLDHHESDLYFPVNAQTREILAKYPLSKSNSSEFNSNIDGQRTFEVPFAYMPAWEKKQGKSMPESVAGMRPDIKGKLLQMNAVDLGDDELARVFDGVVLEGFCIREAKRARTAGITMDDIRLEQYQQMAGMASKIAENSGIKVDEQEITALPVGSVFLDAVKTLKAVEAKFTAGTINPLESSRLREGSLSMALDAMASDYGVLLQMPLQINSLGEYKIIALPKGGTSPDLGTGHFGKEFADLLNRHSPRTGVAPGATLLPENGWCSMHHFEVEKMVIERASELVSVSAEMAEKIAAKNGIHLDKKETTALLVKGCGPASGVFEGKIVAVDESLGVAIQSKGRGEGRVLLIDSLSHVPKVDEMVKVVFKDGKGLVEDRKQDKDLGR